MEVPEDVFNAAETHEREADAHFAQLTGSRGPIARTWSNGALCVITLDQVYVFEEVGEETRLAHKIVFRRAEANAVSKLDE